MTGNLSLQRKTSTRRRQDGPYLAVFVRGWMTEMSSKGHICDVFGVTNTN
jgi:hypothetical protein